MTEEYRSVLSLVVSGFKQSAREAKDAVNEVRVALDEVKQEDAFSQTASDAKDAARAVQETADAARQTGEEARRAGQEAQEAADSAREAVTDAARQAEQDARDAANAARDAATDAASAVGQEMREIESESGGGLFSNLVQRALDAFSTARDFLSGSVSGIQEELATVREEAAQTGESAVRSAEESASRIRGGPIETLKSAFSNFFQGVVQGARRSLTDTRWGLSGLGSDARSGALSFMKYALGIRSLYALANKLRSAFREGMRNLAEYSATTNAALSSMSSALSQLKNSLATAFAPIVEVVAPYLTSFIRHIADAFNAVGAFFAALTGKSSYTRAVYNYQGISGAASDAADSTKKAANAQKELNRQLMGFDQINKLNDNSSGGGGSGGGGGGAGGGSGSGNPLQFVTESIPGVVTDWANALREAWENADFTDIGGTIGAKLRDVLDNIPWEKVQDGARRAAKSLATLINGFVETEGLGRSIGNTVAQAFNTGFEFVNTGLETMHWDSLGKFVSEAIQSGIHTFKGEHIGKFISDSIIAGLDFASGFTNAIDPDQLGKDLYEDLKGALTSIKYGEIAAKFFSLLSDALKKAQQTLGSLLGSFANDVTKWATDDTGKIDFAKIAKAYWEGFKKALDVAKPARDFFASLNVPNPLAEIVKTWETIDLAAEILKPLKDKGLGDSFGEVASSIVKGFKTAFDDLPTYVESVINGIKKYLGGLKIDLNPFDGNGVGIKENISLTAAVTGEIIKAIDKTNGKAVVENATAKAEKFKDDVHGAQVDNVTAKAEKFKDSVSNPVVSGAKAIATKFSDSIRSGSKKLSGFKATVTDVSLSSAAKSALKSAIKRAASSVSIAVKKATTRAKGGVFQNGRWSDIPQYAGGTLNAGTVFAAGENGPEVVGHIGGRTEVLNKSQIASAIYSAMVSAVAQYKSFFGSVASSIAQIPKVVSRYPARQQSVPAMAMGGTVPAQYSPGGSFAESLARQLSAQIGSTGSNQPIRVQVVLDGRVVAESTVRHLKQQSVQGRHPLSSIV